MSDRWEAVRRRAAAGRSTIHAAATTAATPAAGAPASGAGHVLAEAALLQRDLCVLPYPPDAPVLHGCRAVFKDYFVAYSSALSAPQIAFSLAHELGHIVLGHEGEQHCADGDIDEQPVTERLPYAWGAVESYNPRQQRELEANVFATAFLLPPDALRERFVAGEGYQQLAAHFGVSLAATLNALATTLLAPQTEKPAPQPATPATPAPRPALAPLDPSQKLAAEVPEGPVLVNAGPGTGKTRTLIGRVLYLLGQGVPARQILAVTFSNRATNEMRERVQMAAPDHAHALTISTFHAFCLELLRRHHEAAGLPADVTVIDGIDAILLLERNLGRLGLERYLNPVYPELYLKDILRAISRAKDELVTPERYAELAEAARRAAEMPPAQSPAADGSAEVPPAQSPAAGRKGGELPPGVPPSQSLPSEGRGGGMPPVVGSGVSDSGPQRGRVREGEPPAQQKANAHLPGLMPLEAGEDAVVAAAKWAEVARVYGVYEQLLAERGFVDFGGLIMRTVLLLRDHPTLLAQLRQEYRHILVDEYQDMNRASARLLQLLAGDGKGLWVVGDLRQAIYRFRGASPANIVGFGRDFPGGRTRDLGMNYRSEPALVALFRAAGDGMALTGAAACTWESFHPGEAPPRVWLATADDGVAEAEGIAREILRRRGDGRLFREQAVLVRTHTQAELIAAALERADVPVLYLGDLYVRGEVRNLLALIALADGDRGALLRVGGMEAHWLSREDRVRLILAAQEAQQPFPAALAFAAGAGLDAAAVAAASSLQTALEAVGGQTDPWQFLARYLFGHGTLIRRLLSDGTATGAQQLMAIGQLLGVARAFGLRPKEAAPAAPPEHRETQEAVRPDREASPSETASHLERQEPVRRYAPPGVDGTTPDSGEEQGDNEQGNKVFGVDALGIDVLGIDVLGDEEARESATPIPSPSTPLGEFLAHVRHLVALDEDGARTPDGGDGVEAVRLLTIHAAKGLEFPVVYVPNLARGRFPHQKQWDAAPPPPGMVEAIDGADEDQLEETCLFFVAISRARNELVLSRAARYGKRNSSASSFLELLDSFFDGAPPGRLHWPATTLQPEGEGVENGSGGPTRRRLRVWEVELYRRCPRRYEYQFVLSLPEREDELAYKRFHDCVYLVFSRLRQGGDSPTNPPVPEAALAALEEVWGTEGPVGHPYEALYREIAGRLVTQFCALRAATVNGTAWREFLDIALGGAVVRIPIDASEVTADGTVRLIRTRTGRPRDDDGRDERLSLLREAATETLDGRGRLSIELEYVSSGETVVVKPSAARYERQRVAALEEAVTGILAGEFPAKPREPHDCLRCPYWVVCPS